MAVRVKTLPARTISTPGQRVALIESPLMVYAATIQSLSSNTGSQYFGDEDVDSDNGIKFEPGDIVEVEGPPSSKGQEQFDLSQIYVDSSSAGAEIRVVAWVRV